MREKTKKEYISIAENFYRTRLNNQELNADNIWGALLRCAPDYAPSYFNRLKCAIAFHQNSIGNGWTAKIVRGTRNPVKAIPGGFPVTVSSRARSISMDKLNILISFLEKNGYEAECAALLIIYQTGARPCELQSMKVVDDCILIDGAKKTENGNRGADRVLTGNTKHFSSSIDQLLSLLRNSGKSPDAIRLSIYEAVRLLFPGDKKQISMYTMRHQFGANLKASGMSRVEMAYIMGHQSTESVSRYGDKRRGLAGAVMVRAVAEADFSQVRDKAATKIWNRKPEAVSPESSPPGLQHSQKSQSKPSC
ncbi:MAG: site-specific integrase [Pseudomonas profundi]|uniref:site-specific integrase n=1 Tax=Pseudomonas profundi TaxID=1981513 RepID=UPI0030018954